MKKPDILSILTILLVFFLGSCTSSNKEQLVPSVCKTDDPAYQVSYHNDMVPIFESNCYGCHGKQSNENSGGIILEDTTVLNKYIANGQLLSNINHTSDHPMPPPPAPQLSTCEITQITTWINQGYPKN